VTSTPRLTGSWLVEALKRLLQLFAGMALLDFPGLIRIRMVLVRRAFDFERGVLLGKHFYFIRPHGLGGGYLRVGTNTRINHNVEIDYSGGVDIGRNVWISQNVLIETHLHQRGPGPKDDWPIVRLPLTIADDAWIGANAIILPNVRLIGRGAIVGAGSVVTRDVPDGAVVAGVPARGIEDRADASPR
jgi:acetyltransferase-like isoleucine patch superfamily enzyme